MPIITIVVVILTAPCNPGYLASRGGLAETRDSMAQIRDILGNPGWVETLHKTILVPQ